MQRRRRRPDARAQRRGECKRRQAASPDATTTYAYTCQNIGAADCLVFKGTKLYKTIKTGLQSPVGVAAGKDGHFYVADQSAQGDPSLFRGR